MEHVQMFQLVACFLLLNFAQMADEMMHMMSLVLRHRFLRHQATLLMVEHRRRRKRVSTANGSLYLRYSVECFATCSNTRKHKIA